MLLPPAPQPFRTSQTSQTAFQKAETRPLVDVFLTLSRIDENVSQMSSDMSGPQLGLQRITALLAKLGSPHLKVPIIHVAGTNGKGSICVYLDSILRRAGYRTGRFNSPHLIEPSDSVILKGSPSSSRVFEAMARKVEEASRSIEASPFEQLTATAFSLFAEAEPALDVAVIEVGMGGRDDATNVCPNPLATILGPVDLDHQALLGNTVEEIARVKCGIFKAGSLAVVSAQTHPEVIRVAKEEAAKVDASLVVAEEGQWQRDGSLRIRSDGLDIIARPSLPGAYQSVNASVAATTAWLLNSRGKLKISEEAIVEGIESTEWAGRLSSVSLPGISSPILVDGAHNPSSAQHLRSYIDSLPAKKSTTFIIALSSPRDPISILEPLLKGMQGAQVIATRFSVPVEGMPWVKPVQTSEIVETARTLGVQVKETADLREAISMATGHIVVCGSLYLVADLYRLQQKAST